MSIYLIRYGLSILGLDKVFSLPVDGRGEDVVRFEERREGKEDEHDGGGPIEELQGEGG